MTRTRSETRTQNSVTEYPKCHVNNSFKIGWEITREKLDYHYKSPTVNWNLTFLRKPQIFAI